MRPIGRGGMAEVWLARLGGALGFQKQVVLKRLLPRYVRDQRFVDMFIAEARVASHLNHANVVSVWDFGETDGQYFMAMEYVPGWDLYQALAQACNTGRTPHPEVIAYVLSAICRGLHHVHEARDPSGRALGIVHQDISPSNVLMSRDGQIKVGDFGVAHARSERGGSAISGRLRGKLGYLSPERLKAGSVVDRRSDILAAGIILYEAMTLKRLFRCADPIETVERVGRCDIRRQLAAHREIPAELARIIQRSVTANPSDRYHTAGLMADALDDWLHYRRRVSARDVKQWLTDLFEDGLPQKFESLSDTSARPPRSRSSAMLDKKLRRARFVFQEGTAGAGFGPIPYTAVLDLVRRRELSPDEPVSVNGAEWRPVREITELACALSHADDSGEEPEEVGMFDRMQLVSLVARLCVASATGRLRLSSGPGDVIKDVVFQAGKVVHVTSTRKDELLGPWLVKNGAANNVQVQIAYGRSRSYGEALGPVLMSLGFIPAAGLYRLIRQYRIERLQELLSWEGGQYRWYTDGVLEAGTAPIAFDPRPAIWQAVRDRLTHAMLAQHYRRMRDPRLYRRERNAATVVPYQLTPTELRFERALTGPAKKVSELMTLAAGEQQASLIRVLFLLHQLGELRVVTSM